MKKTVAVMLCMALILVGCRANNPETFTSMQKTSFDHFGTISSVVVYDNFASDRNVLRFESVWEEIVDELDTIEKSIGVSIEESDVYRFNQAKPGQNVIISNITAGIVKRAMNMYVLTSGAYNPAVCNLVDLWGFSPRIINGKGPGMPYDREKNADGSFDLPKRRYISAFRQLADFSAIKLDGDDIRGYTLTKNVNDIVIDGVEYTQKIDLGGIGKGYAADRVAEILRKNGYKYGMVNIGLSSLQLLKRNVSNKGAPGDNQWVINVSDPNDRNETFATTYGKDTGISTSGTYQVRYYINGRAYSHIIDPNTGEPTQSDIVSVTLIGPSAADCDALSTALCVMGTQSALTFIAQRLENYKVIIIAKDGEGLKLITNMAKSEYISSGMRP